MKVRLYALGLLGIAALFACHPIFFWDMNVSWTLDGGTNASSCSKYNIAEWEVFAEGVDPPGMVSISRRFPCGSWDAGQKFFQIEEGYYKVHVRALEKNTNNVLAEKSATVHVYQDDMDPDHKDFAFSSSDFCKGGGTGNAIIDIYWNINGTQDGTATGDSWDKCSEVGAEKVVVTIGCKRKKEFDCHAQGNMSGSVKVSDGDHNIAVKLVDKNGTDLTMEAAGTIKALVGKPGEFTGDFYYNSFKAPLKATTTGTYHYATSFGSAKTSCLDTTPVVAHTMVYLEEPKDKGGKPVNAQFCGPNSSCYKTNGADLGKCWAKDKAVTIGGLTWGLYSMTLQGGISGTSGFEACWKKTTYNDQKGKTDILVGAGVSNPTRAINLPKTGTSSTCM